MYKINVINEKTLEWNLKKNHPVVLHNSANFETVIV